MVGHQSFTAFQRFLLNCLCFMMNSVYLKSDWTCKFQPSKTWTIVFLHFCLKKLNILKWFTILFQFGYILATGWFHVYFNIFNRYLDRINAFIFNQLISSSLWHAKFTKMSYNYRLITIVYEPHTIVSDSSTIVFICKTIYNACKL